MLIKRLIALGVIIATVAFPLVFTDHASAESGCHRQGTEVTGPIARADTSRR